MIRYLHIIITFLFCFLSISTGWAQKNNFINVTINVTAPNPNASTKEVMPDIPVGKGWDIYVFHEKNKAQAFFNNITDRTKDSQSGLVMVTDSKVDYKEIKQTDNNGSCNFFAKPQWYFVVYNKELQRVSENIIGIKGKEQNQTIIVKTKSATGDKELDNVDVKAKFIFETPVDSSYDCGDLRIVDIIWPISHKETNITYRMGMAPYCMEISGNDYGFTSEYQKLDSKTGKIFKIMMPCLVDGEQYHKTQRRKMGYDPVVNDPLDRYVQSDTMVSHAPTYLHIRGQMTNIKSDAFYPVWAYKWCENYKSLISSETMLLNLGYRTDRTKFLDFEFPDIAIDKNYYKRDPKVELTETAHELRIEFIRGQSEISPTDSAGLQKLEDIIQAIGKIVDQKSGAQLMSINIHGYASPEGGWATNDRLSKSRAAYLKQRLVSQLGISSSDIDSEGSVMSWKDVVSQLRIDSLNSEDIDRANLLDEIISSSRDEASVENKLRSLPLYSYLRDNEEKYYKPLRRVTISYVYVVNRPLTEEEIIRKYEETKSADFPYQYQVLFDYLIDRPEELGNIAKAAMREVPEPRTGKPWTLAAYYLAKSYTARNLCDTTILEPYISNDPNEFIKAFPDSYVSPLPLRLNSYHILNGDTIQRINDQGIIVQQISMFVQANKISKALNLATHMLPKENPLFQQPIMMLEVKCKKKYNDEEYREKVAQTSDWNKVVVYAAQDANKVKDEIFWKESWVLLNDTSKFHMQAARELYMKAILAYRLYNSAKSWNQRKDDNTPVPTTFFDMGSHSIYDAPPFEDDSFPWGAYMIKACEMEPSFINLLKFDGEFNQNYRDGFAKFWNRKHPEKILR